MQTVRYMKFINGVYAPEKIVFVRADDMNWFTTDIPPVPPGEDANETFAGRWSRVTVSHTSPIEALVANERRFYPAEKTPIEVVTDHVFK